MPTEHEVKAREIAWKDCPVCKGKGTVHVAVMDWFQEKPCRTCTAHAASLAAAVKSERERWADYVEEQPCDGWLKNEKAICQEKARVIRDGDG